MKFLPPLALLVSVLALGVSSFSYLNSVKFNAKAELAITDANKVAESLGELVYLKEDPRLKISLEDMSVKFDKYSNKLNGKIRIDVTNKDFPVKSFRVRLHIKVKDSAGVTVGESYEMLDVNADSIVSVMSDNYLLTDDNLRPVPLIFSVDSYSWSPEDRVFHPVN